MTDGEARPPGAPPSPGWNWRDRGFLHLWAAQGISAVGSRITRTVLPLMAILLLGASPAEVAVLSALQVAPGILVGLLLGGLVDRGSKRRLLVGADLLRAVVLVSVPLAAWGGVLTVSHLGVVAAVIGAASALFDMADNAWLPELLGRDRLVAGNARLNATESLAEITGPGLGGLLMQWLTAPVALLADAASYLVSAALIGRIRTTGQPPAALPRDPSAGLFADAVTGARAAWDHPLVRPLMLLRGSNAFFGGFFLALYTLFCVQDLGLSPGMLGAVISVGGVGAMISAVLLARRASSGRVGPLLIGAALLTEVTALALPAAGFVSSHVLALTLLVLHQLVSDGFRMVAWTLEASLRQAALPGEVLGRATGTLHALIAVLMPLGAVVAGLLAEGTSVRAAILVGILGGLTGPLALLASRPLRELDRMPGS